MKTSNCSRNFGSKEIIRNVFLPSEREPSKYLTPLLILLVFNGEIWPTITPCTVTGEGDTLVSDTATCSSAITHHVSSYASHVITQIACPKYPESKDRVPKSFSFIPRACVFRLAPRCCLHLSSLCLLVIHNLC